MKKIYLACLILSIITVSCKKDSSDDMNTAITDTDVIANLMNENLVLPPGAFTVDPSTVTTDNSITINSSGNGRIPLSAGQQMTNTISFNAPNANINAVGMRFGASGPIYFVPVDANGATDGTGAFDFLINSEICDDLAQICHDIVCYEFAQTSSGQISAANIQDVAMVCGGCDEPACQSLLDCGQLNGADGSPRFNLTWSGGTDLDLYVTDPSGETISYTNTSSSSGGMLDVDCTGNCSGGNSENITWPNGGPSGTYSFYVNYFSGDAATSYNLIVRDNMTNITTYSGSLNSGDSQTYTYTKN